MLMEKAAAMLSELPVPPPVEEDSVIEEWELEQDDKGFEVYKEGEAYYVDGGLIREIMAAHQPGRSGFDAPFPEAAYRFWRHQSTEKSGRKDGRYRIARGAGI